MSTKSSKAPSPPIFLSSNLLSLNSSSTSRPPRRSASPFRPRCCCGRIRSSSRRSGRMPFLLPCARFEVPIRTMLTETWAPNGGLVSAHHSASRIPLGGGGDEYGWHTPSAFAAPAGARLLDLPRDLRRRSARHRGPAQGWPAGYQDIGGG